MHGGHTQRDSKVLSEQLCQVRMSDGLTADREDGGGGTFVFFLVEDEIQGCPIIKAD